MNEYATSINSQYGQSNLIEKITKALERAGKNLDHLNLDDLAPFDELHAGGRDATRALAKLAGLQPGMNVLDVGSGIGGPVRTLASEFSCQVVGIDLTNEFVEAATMLTGKVSLSHRVSFRQGSALNLPFNDGTFDVVWSQNTFMNIEDKETAIREAIRVLRPEGILAIETNLAGSQDGLEYPVFWANHPGISFLITSEEFRGLMTRAGLIELKWEDVTQWAIEGARRQQAIRPEERPLLGLNVIYEDVPLKARNTLRGLEEGQITDIRAVYKRTP
jgi:ubiquinone/menaquinone biosynthesis C-methylase UbiE